MEEKIEKVILESYNSLYRLAYCYVRDENDAMDIVQESVYKAIRGKGQVKEEQFIKTWLYKITIRTAIDFLRKKKREVVGLEDYEKGQEDCYQNFDLENAMKLLDEREKAVITLRYFEDRKLSEVAEILGENGNTVKTILYRTLKKLRIHLGREALE